MIKIKTMALSAVKAGEADGLAEGEFTGYASVWDNRDSYGDVMRKGAFAESLKSYGNNGSGIPCYWGHRMDDPDFNLGKTLSAVEDDHGLLVHVALDMESPKGSYVHRLITEDRVKQMSFAYEVTDGSEEKDGDEAFFEIRGAKLFEVSVVPVGANPLAELTGVKALAEAVADIKLGRRTSQKDADLIRQIRNIADELLGDTPEAPEEDGAKAIETALAKLAQLHNRKEPN